MKISSLNKGQKAGRPILVLAHFLTRGRGYYALFFFALSLLLFSPFSSSGETAEYVTGRIISPVILGERIVFTPGDKVYTDLGAKDGLIKGDILRVTETTDTELINPTGRCAVVRVDDETSICELISVKKEITRGNVVFTNKLHYTEAEFYPIIYVLLNKTVESYPPHTRPTVYIHNIFDKHLNITKLSMRIKNEVENIFAQKNRVILLSGASTKDFQFYPVDSQENRNALDRFIKRENVDVVISGLYAPDNGSIDVTFHKYDRRLGREVLAFQTEAAAGAEVEDAKEIVAPYKAVESREPVACTISYNELTDSVVKYGKAEIIRFEAEGNAFSENDLKSREFNVIAPIDVVITIDGQKVNFGETNQSKATISRGSHKIGASFRRGYFFNSRGALAYSSKKVVNKEMILLVRKDGDINIAIDLNPEFDKEGIAFKVYKETVNVRSQIKPIRSMKSETKVETYVD